MPALTTIYGIKACDTMKKSFAALTAAGKDYVFHDYKKSGVSTEILQRWITELGIDSLINKRGTTWRKLSAEQQALSADPQQAITLMMAHTSLIKRPIVESSIAGVTQTFVGFDALQNQLG